MLLQGLIVESQSLSDALAEILHEHVALRGQAIDDLACFGPFQVERDTLLVFVVGFEIKIPATSVGRATCDRHDAAPRVAPLALFKFDYLGAHIPEHLGRNRALLPYRPVDNPNAGKRTFHDCLYTTSRPVRLVPGSLWIFSGRLSSVPRTFIYGGDGYAS